MKLVAETIQELQTQKRGRTDEQLHPFHGVSCIAVLVQAPLQEHTDLTGKAAAVVAVVTAVGSALDFPLTPEEAALCSCKVSTAHVLHAQSHSIAHMLLETKGSRIGAAAAASTRYVTMHHAYMQTVVNEAANRRRHGGWVKTATHILIFVDCSFYAFSYCHIVCQYVRVCHIVSVSISESLPANPLSFPRAPLLTSKQQLLRGFKADQMSPQIPIVCMQ